MTLRSKGTHPGALGWFCAVTSLLTLVGLCYLSLIGLSVSEIKFAHTKLSETIGQPNANITKIENLLAHFVNSPTYLSSAADFLSPFPSIDSSIPAKLAQAIQLVSQDSLEQADLVAGPLLSYLEYSEGVTQRLRDKATRIPLAKRMLHEALDAEAKKQRIQNSAAETERRIANTVEKHKLIAQDFAEFFSLNSAYAYSRSGKLLIYQEGVLKGLPMLERLPDSISSLSSLKAELEGLGATVKVDSQDAYGSFTSKLERLRKASNTIELENAGLRKRLTNQMVNIGSLDNLISSRKRSFSILCAEVLLLLLDPTAFW